jgi:hypothetical protein
VKKIEEGTPEESFILLTTAMLLTILLKPKIKKNITQYINSGLTYSRYG